MGFTGWHSFYKIYILSQVNIYRISSLTNAKSKKNIVKPQRGLLSAMFLINYFCSYTPCFFRKEKRFSHIPPIIRRKTKLAKKCKVMSDVDMDGKLAWSCVNIDKKDIFQGLTCINNSLVASAYYLKHFYLIF